MSDHRGRGQGRGAPRARGGPPRGGPSPSSSGRATPIYDRGRGGPPRGFSDRGGGGGRGRGGYAQGPVIFKEGIKPVIPPRLSDSNHQKLIERFHGLKVKPNRPLRPGYGTLGTPITLRANFHGINHNGPIYDYTISITPNTDINRIKGRIFELLELSPACQPHLLYIAHDRSQRLVSAQQLPQPLNISVTYYEDGDNGPRAGATVYTLSIKLDRVLDSNEVKRYTEGDPAMRDYDPLPYISALNLALQQHTSRVAVRVGKSERTSAQQPKYFFPTAAKNSLGQGLIAVQGFYASVRPTFNQLLVNVNVCFAAFVEPGNLADALLAFNRNSRGAMPTLPKSLVKSIKVKTRHLGYTKPLLAILTTSVRNTYVDIPDLGGRISVEKYFSRKYPNYKLKYPADLPAVDIGSAKRPVFVPAELCDIIPGCVFKGKLSETQTAEMIKYACNIPKVNADAIVDTGFPKMGYSPLQAPASGFNITVDPEMVQIPARELPPPGLSYRAGRASANNGSWNILDVKFQRGAQITSWWVLVVIDSGRRDPTINGPGDPNLGQLVQGFRDKLKRSGMAIPDGLPRLLPPANLNTIGNDDSARTNALERIRGILKQALQQSAGKKPSFVLVLLENRDNFIYPGIKRIGDVELGIHTIHMQLRKALNEPRKQDQYLSNIALKVNTKLGGLNHLLSPNDMGWLTRKSTMMVGIDVTHPGPGSREGTPSIAAVVASIDSSFVQFPASMRIQKKSKKEMLDELRDMMVERLLVYEKKNSKLPERILVYRDGVSEGQFDTVLEEELAQILEAFKKMSTGSRGTYRPKLSIIICGKRHHAKFFATDSQHADKNGNTRPGTVVDKGITGVFDHDFYLQAHAGLQGHVKATHYTVVYDENSLGANEIQQGTHVTSYLYARATKAVSLIPAAYYADLACERGRCYLNDFLVADDQTTVSGRSGRLSREEEAARVYEAAKKAWGEGLHPDMRASMFYI